MAIVSRPIHTSPTKGRVAFQPASNVKHNFHPETTRAQQDRPTAPMQQPQLQARQQSSSPPVIAPQARSAAPPSSRVMSHFDQKKRTQSLTPPISGVDSVTDSASKRSTRSLDNGSAQTAESWRKHGKKFRANLVLADDAQGDNVFTLSESCTIERYYRVADRVLQQFLSSDISKRDGMVESYLIGNRLFKFLSVVLPTHNDYFAPDERLSSLRMKSQNQLIELLEYMEELEVMIDEMEYNHHMMTATNLQQH
ncbi:MAG: hypothetical protein SGILL_006677, partial [Bacillariaceae sp.]